MCVYTCTRISFCLLLSRKVLQSNRKKKRSAPRRGHRATSGLPPSRSLPTPSLRFSLPLRRCPRKRETAAPASSIIKNRQRTGGNIYQIKTYTWRPARTHTQRHRKPVRPSTTPARSPVTRGRPHTPTQPTTPATPAGSTRRTHQTTVVSSSCTHRHTDTHTYLQRNIHADRQTDREIDREIYDR